jgi:hypothetical protein
VVDVCNTFNQINLQINFAYWTNSVHFTVYFSPSFMITQVNRMLTFIRDGAISYSKCLQSSLARYEFIVLLIDSWMFRNENFCDERRAHLMQFMLHNKDCFQNVS